MSIAQTTQDLNTEASEADVAGFVHSCFRFVIGAALTYGAFCVLTLVLWTWLAAVLALLLSVIGEKVVLKLADKQLDAAAQVTADALVSGYSWLRGKFAAPAAK